MWTADPRLRVRETGVRGAPRQMPTRDMAKQETPSPVISGTGPATGEHGEALVNSGGGGRREGLDINPYGRAHGAGGTFDDARGRTRRQARQVPRGWAVERCAPNRGRADVEHEQHPRSLSTTQKPRGRRLKKETRDEERRHTEETTRDTQDKPGGESSLRLYLPRPPPPSRLPAPYTAYTV